MHSAPVRCLFAILVVSLLSYPISVVSAEDFHTPVFYWAQDPANVYIKIHISDPTDVSVSVSSGERARFQFSAKKGDIPFKLELELLNSINSQKVQWKKINSFIDCTLPKSGTWTGKAWKRLLLSREKPPNMRVDWQRMKIEEEDEEDIQERAAQIAREAAHVAKQKAASAESKPAATSSKSSFPKFSWSKLSPAYLTELSQWLLQHYESAVYAVGVVLLLFISVLCTICCSSGKPETADAAEESDEDETKVEDSKASQASTSSDHQAESSGDASGDKEETLRKRS